MKKNYLLIFMCLITGSIIVAAQQNQQQPKIAQKRKPCCPNGECIKQAQQPKQSAAPSPQAKQNQQPISYQKT